MPATSVRPNDVFINLPFDNKRERIFLAYVASLTGLGLNPRCVLEVSPDHDRLRRLSSLMRQCAYSIHDLSAVQVSGRPFRVPRFNMPFELGMCAATSVEGPHRFRVFETVPHRVGQSLSDLQGYEPFIHHGTVSGVISAVMDAFEDLNDKRLIEEEDIRWVYRRLRIYRSAAITGSIFRPTAFKRLSVAAVEFVNRRGTKRG